MKKILLAWMLMSLLIPFSNLQSNVNPYQPSAATASGLSYEPFSGQTDALSGEYNRPGSDFNVFDNTLLRDGGWLELPYGDTENAVKVPVNNAWGVWLLALSGYILILAFRKKSKYKL